MRGVSNVIAISALLLIAMGLVAILLPWAWNSMTQVVDTMSRFSQARSLQILADVVFYPPPVVPPEGNDALLIIANVGDVTLTNVKVLEVKPDLTQTELNSFIVKKDGGTTSWSTYHSIFSPGDVLVARVPYDKNYLGYQFILQSPQYSEAYMVGD